MSDFYAASGADATANSGRPPPLLAAALALAARGIPVFPMAAGKTPLAGSHGVRDATADPDRLAEMFRLPGATLVAIACGERSGISVLDIDRQHGGLAWWQENRHRIPETWAWRTRHGGLHLAMKHRPGLRTVSLGTIGAGVEIRSTGASAIYWPAVGLPLLCDADPAAWPSWLLPPPKPAPPPPCYSPHDARPPQHVESALAGLVRIAALAGEGRRNAALFWAASRAAEMTGRGEIARHHAEAVLIAAASHCGLDHREAVATVASAFRGGR